MSPSPASRRTPVAYTVGLAGVAAATTWCTLVSWRTFVEDPAGLTVSLFYLAVLIAVIGGAGRWLRVPALVILFVQLVASAAGTLQAVTGSVLPTPTNLRVFGSALESAVASAQEYVAPIPADAAPLTALLLPIGVAVLVVIDVLAGALRRIPLAGLVLLAVYSVPVSITGNGVSWLVFILIASGFLCLLYLVHAEHVLRWGRGIDANPARAGARRDAETDEDAADQPSSFDVHTGAIRGSALAIGATATALAIALPLAVPTLDVAFFDGTGPGKRDIEVSDPMVDLRRDLNRGEDIPLAWVTTTEKNPTYFRMAVLTRFNGDTWTPGDRDIPDDQVARGEMPELVGVADGTRRSESSYRVRIDENFESRWLPTTAQVSSMDVPGDWRFDTTTMDFMSADDDSTAGMTYGFNGVDVVPDPQLLDNAASGIASVSSTYLDIPDAMPSEIRDYALSVTQGEETRFRQARALQQWFRETGGFEYSTDILDDETPTTLTSFLRESGRVGYCEQFAAAMAIMARTIGIPSRVAVGFLESRPAGANVYEFSAHDLHAWPELFFPGAGWVRFEPTPGTRAPTVPSYTDGEIAPVETDTPTPSASASTEPAPTRAPQPEADDTTSEDTSSFPWVPVALSALGVVLVAALVMLPGLLRRRRRERRLLGSIEEVWLELRDHTIDLGHGWPTGRSPRTTGAWLARLLGPPERDAATERPRRGPRENLEAAASLDRLVEQIERARYSRSGASVDHEAASHDARVIESALDHGVTKRVVRRARWLPASLRRPAPYTPATEVVTRETSDSVRG